MHFLLVIACALQIVFAARFTRWFADHHVLGFDSLMYFNAALAITQDKDPYVKTGYIYPPPLAVALLPMTELPLQTANLLWVGFVVISAFLLILALRTLVPWPVAITSTLLFAPTWSTIAFGQVGLLLAAMSTIAIVATEHGRIRCASTLLTLGVLLKLTPIVGLVVLFFRRPRPAAATAGAILVVTLLLTLPVVGIDAWVQGLTRASTAPPGPLWFDGVGPFLTMIPGPAGRFGPLVLLGALSSVVLLRRSLNPATALAAILLVPLIAAPIIWTHHMVGALPALALLWRCGRKEQLLAVLIWLCLGMGFGIAVIPILWIVLTFQEASPPRSTSGSSSLQTGSL